MPLKLSFQLPPLTSDSDSEPSGFFYPQQEHHLQPHHPANSKITASSSSATSSSLTHIRGGQDIMDVQNMFRRLTDPMSSLSRSHEFLRNLRKRLKRVGAFGIPDGDRCEYFEVFYNLLGDNRWKVVCEATMLMVDLIPLMADYELDHCVTLVLPRVIPNLGHFSTDVRRASLRLLHVYMRYTHNLQKVLRLYIQYGLTNQNRTAQKGCILSLPLLFTEEFSNENLFPLVESLSDLLVIADTNLFYPVFLAMQKLHTLVGKDRFKIYLTHVRKEAVVLYQRVLSRNSTGNSDFFEENRNSPVTINNFMGRDGGSPSKLQGSPHQQSPTHQAHKSPSPTHGKAVFPPSAPPELQPSLSYGLFPRLLIRRALSEKMPDKLDALRQMLLILNEAPSNHVQLIEDYLSDFMKSFAKNIFESCNYKVTLYALDIISSLVDRLKMGTIGILRPLIFLLIKHLGDSRSLVREQNIKIVHKLMYSLPPQIILDSLLEHKFHRNPKVREEIVNRVTAAVLSFSKRDFNLPRLSGEVSTMLVDNKRVVRLAAIECVAVLSNALGPINVDTIFSAVKQVQMQSDAYGLMMAVQARLARREVPRVSPEGMVKHLLNPINFASWLPSDPSDADIEWVMLGSGSTPSTPCLMNHPKKDNYSQMQQQQQVSFDLSTDLESESADRRFSLGKLESDASALTQIPVGRKKKCRAHQLQRMPSDASSGDSFRSDDSKARELWRYYLSVFKDTNEPVVPRISYPGDTYTPGRRPFSDPESDTSCDSVFRHPTHNDPHASNPNNNNNNTKHTISFHHNNATSNNIHSPSNQNQPVQQTLTPANGANFTRTSSMPALTSGHLSDIEERSVEESRSRLSRNQSNPQNRSPEPASSPERKGSIGSTMSMDPCEPRKDNESPSQMSKHHLSVEGGHDSPNQMDANRPQSISSAGSEATQIVNVTEKQEQGNLDRNPKDLKGVDTRYKMDENEGNLHQVPDPNLKVNPAMEAEKEKERRELVQLMEFNMKKDGQTQKDDLFSDSNSSDLQTVVETDRSRSFLPIGTNTRRNQPRYISKSKSPSRKSRNPYQTMLEPAIPSNIDMFGILDNVAKNEGSFVSPEEALRAAIAAFTHDAWTTKVEGMLAVSRLATFHPQVLAREIHTVILALVYEVKNLRSTVARSAIFTLGDLFVKMKKHVEPDIDAIGHALLGKCGETMTFIKEDLDRALTNMVEEMPQSKAVLSLINGGAQIAAQYIWMATEKMGPNKCLVGPRDVAEYLLPASAKFIQDGNPITRYYGRCLLFMLYPHSQFEKLSRRFLSPMTYRNIQGILESIKRRGVGEKPAELPAPKN